MKKGFTLIELLGVIVILGILVLILFPNILNQVKKSKKAISEATKSLVIDAAKDYVEDNINDYHEINENTYCINVSTLVENNYLNEKIKDENLNDLDTTKKVKLTYKNSKFEYEVVDECEASQGGQITNMLITHEIEKIRSKVNSTIPDGIYYYNSSGNLEDGNNIIYTNSDNTFRGNILVHNHQFISGCINYGSENYDIYKTTVTTSEFPCSTLRGENLVVNGDLSYGSNANFPNLTYNNDGYLSKSGDTQSNILLENQLHPVDVDNKSYALGLQVRTNNITSKNYLGFYEYDIDRKVIGPNQIMYLTSNEITLTQELKNGDEYIYLSDLSTWKTNASQTYQRGFIFWNYTDSTGYTYPPLTYSRNAWGNLYENENIDLANNRIKLTSAWNHGTFPVGTKLSQTNSGSTFNYVLIQNGAFQTNWMNLDNSVSGTQGGSLNNNKFRPGTKYIKFATLFNYNKVVGVTNNYKDFYLREIIN